MNLKIRCVLTETAHRFSYTNLTNAPDFQFNTKSSFTFHYYLFEIDVLSFGAPQNLLIPLASKVIGRILNTPYHYVTSKIIHNNLNIPFVEDCPSQVTTLFLLFFV